jgi:glycosyltransferase involved in cell wall biosynthesis
MKILIVNSLYFPNRVGGAEVSVQLLAEALSAIGHDVYIVCLSNGGEAYRSHINGVCVYRLNLFNIYWPFENSLKKMPVRLVWHGLEIYNPVMIARFDSVVREIQPDIVHTNNIHGFSTGIWKSLTRRKIPIIHTLRDYALLCSRGNLYKNNQRCSSRCIECKSLCHVKCVDTNQVESIVGISRHILDSHIKHGFFKNRKFQNVIHNSVSAHAASQIRVAKSDSNEIVFGYIGRLVAEKGIVDLVEAFESVARRYKHVRLIIAGTGSEAMNARLRALAGSRVQFEGHVSPEKFYDSVDIVVVPSLWDEPFGRTVAEAISAGRAVIGSNRGGISELLRGRKNCHIYDPDERDALSRALECAVSRHPAQPLTLSEKNEQMSDVSFDPQSIARLYLRAYEEAIRGKEHVLHAN